MIAVPVSTLMVRAILSLGTLLSSFLAAGLPEAANALLRGVAWVAEHRAPLQGAAVALGALVLVSWDPPMAGLMLIDGILVLAAVALIAAISRVVKKAAEHVDDGEHLDDDRPQR